MAICILKLCLYLCHNFHLFRPLWKEAVVSDNVDHQAPPKGANFVLHTGNMSHMSNAWPVFNTLGMRLMLKGKMY